MFGTFTAKYEEITPEVAIAMQFPQLPDRPSKPAKELVRVLQSRQPGIPLSSWPGITRQLAKCLGGGMERQRNTIVTAIQSARLTGGGVSGHGPVVVCPSICLPLTNICPLARALLLQSMRLELMKNTQFSCIKI